MPNISKIKISGTSYNIKDENATSVVSLTQAEYDALVSAGTVNPTVLYNITDATPVDLSNYYTSAQTNSAINAAVANKVDKSAVTSSVTSASTDTEIPTAKAVFDAIPTGGTGGGKAIEAGRGITVTTGETADTVSFSLPISAGTGTGSLIIGDNGGGTSYASVASGKGAVVFPSRRFYGSNYATGESSFAHGSGCSAETCNHAEGFNTKCIGGFVSHSEGDSTEVRGAASHAEGYHTLAGKTGTQSGCHSEGYYTSALTSYSHSEGKYTIANNTGEHASGIYNISNTGNSTSAQTLFSVGNGTANNARHNAFEIRQNGDIYITLNDQDVKLQDQLGGSSITVDQTIISGSTNAVAGGAVYDRFDEVEQVTAMALNELSEADEVAARALVDLDSRFGGLKLVKITQSAYDALTTKDSNTLYVITS